MSDTPLQSTLREMRAVFTNRTALVALGAISLALGLSGPFQTFELLGLVPRLFYWAGMALLTFATGMFFGGYAMRHADRLGWARAVKIVMGGLAAGIPVSAVVLALNVIAFGKADLEGFGLFTAPIYCIAVSMVITLVLQSLRPGNKGEVSAPRAQRLMARLPIEKRGPLISMSVHDHYVEITTARGTHLALMRFADAIAETTGADGIQIHRSHWVALDGIAKIFRADGRLMIETSAGTQLPVSRSFQSAVREAGLLPG